MNEETLLQRYLQLEQNNKLDKPGFIHNLHVLDREGVLVTYASLYIHLMDQLEWQLLSQEEVREGAELILNHLHKVLKITATNLVLKWSDEKITEQMIEQYEHLLACAAGGIKEHTNNN